MPVTNALVCAETILTTAALSAASTEIVADPGTGSATKRINLNFCNVTDADVTIDVARVFNGTAYRFARNFKVPASDSRIMENVALTNGRSIRARASAAAAIEVVIDTVTRTET